MDDDLRGWLFDPTTAHRLVLARRPSPRSAVAYVVSDVVWHDVVRLLRWAAAGTGGQSELESGRLWRLAAGCADLLRRLPGLNDELGERWDSGPAHQPAPGVSDADAETRLAHVAGGLAALLRTEEPVPLHRLAVEVDALGAAAISALAEQSAWPVPGASS